MTATVAYVAPRSEKVVTVGLATALIRSDIFFWGSLMAGALVVGLPTAPLQPRPRPLPARPGAGRQPA